MADIAIIQRFLPSRSRGGVGYFTDGLASALTGRGHQVTVFSQDPRPAGAVYTVSIVAMATTGVRARLAPLMFPFALRRCDFRHFDVIHAQGDEQLLSRRGLPPVVRTLHGTALAEAWFNGVLGRSPTRLALHLIWYAGELVADLRADAVVAVSRHTLRFYPRSHGVIPNGINVASLAPDGTPKSSHPSVLFIGEVDSRKRGRLLIDVMRDQVRAQVPDAELWLVGPDQVTSDGCRSWGTVDAPTLARLLRQAWVMCLPSAYEGFGRPYAEAMAAGTVVVASPNPGAREVLDDGRLGVIANDDALGPTLVRLLTAPAERAEFQRLGLARARDFDWNVVAAQYERVYEMVIARRAGRARA